MSLLDAQLPNIGKLFINVAPTTRSLSFFDVALRLGQPFDLDEAVVSQMLLDPLVPPASLLFLSPSDESSRWIRAVSTCLSLSIGAQVPFDDPLHHPALQDPPILSLGPFSEPPSAQNLVPNALVATPKSKKFFTSDRALVLLAELVETCLATLEVLLPSSLSLCLLLVESLQQSDSGAAHC